GRAPEADRRAPGAKRAPGSGWRPRRSAAAGGLLTRSMSGPLPWSMSGGGCCGGSWRHLGRPGAGGGALAGADLGDEDVLERRRHGAGLVHLDAGRGELAGEVLAGGAGFARIDVAQGDVEPLAERLPPRDVRAARPQLPRP